VRGQDRDGACGWWLCFWPGATTELLSGGASAKRILLSGSIAGHPVGYGGNTWAFLQWILGFRRLGSTSITSRSARQGLYDEDLKPVPFSKSAANTISKRSIRPLEEWRLALFENGTGLRSSSIKSLPWRSST